MHTKPATVTLFCGPRRAKPSPQMRITSPPINEPLRGAKSWITKGIVYVLRVALTWRAKPAPTTRTSMWYAPALASPLRRTHSMTVWFTYTTSHAAPPIPTSSSPITVEKRVPVIEIS